LLHYLYCTSLTCRNCSSNVHDWASLFRAADGDWTSAERPPDIGTSLEWLDFGNKSAAAAVACLLSAAVVKDTATADGCCSCSCSCCWCICDGCTESPGCWYTRCWSMGVISREPDANCLASWLRVSRSSRCKYK